ncbi:N-terminal TM domain of oligopeptide transport permease C [Thermodesulforhabdus norvegica]|uniref:N-terminal TM domain of oligopeptide transport permease C n=2 Tax=Thermodesulforhabdus norvegica TaxID=39841 RepID=A0A1I4TAE2_9BACT|nr:ABC transporter permease [Thermodesulforhabdus norvegica]SFM73540.1 N-terminal TM domain of oligopeptide transport permease C [Thermodesulforhabdus norvegica]
MLNQPPTDEVLYEKPRSYWSAVWNRFRKNRPAMVGVVFIIWLALIAILAPLLANNKPLCVYAEGRLFFPILEGKGYAKTVVTGKDRRREILLDWKKLRGVKGISPFQKMENPVRGWILWPPVPYSPTEHNLFEILQPPGGKHWLGTDDRGRDVLSRMIHGSRISLSVGMVSVGIAAVFGIILGGMAGYFGGWVDQLINRLIEIMMTIPTFFLIIAIIAFLPPSIYNIMVVIGVTGWTGIARFVRAEFLKLKNLDFVTASRALGTSHARIIFVHMLPNAMAPVLVSVVFGIAGAILTESSLSFLGFGVPPPTPSWGDILSQSRDYIEFAWWLTLFPGLAIFITITAYNLVGEALRDAMDPRLFQ